MSDFKPGWYCVSGPDANGNRTYKYFDTPTHVRSECYTTADGRQVYLWGKKEKPKGEAAQWDPSYSYAADEQGGQWDNEASRTASKKAGGNASGKSPCEDPSVACPVCDQTGLPILPLRYAVARSDVKTKAPTLKAPFDAGVSDIALPGDQAHYTLRLLRPGYLYVFNEKRGEWKGYVVAEGGYLLEYDINSASPPDVGSAKPCARMARSAAARCVMITDAKRAGKVWLGFSDTAWTKTVLDNNRKQAYRERHMQCVDVGTWASGSTQQPGAAPIDRLGEVSEFAMSAPQPSPLQLMTTVMGFRAFAYSLHDFHDSAGEGPALIQAANLAAKKGPAMMAAVRDPVGVTMELASLMSTKLREFMSQPKVQWPLATTSTIDSLERIVKDRAISSEISTQEMTGAYVMNNPGAVWAGVFDKKTREVNEEAKELLSKTTPAQLNQAANSTWNKYLAKLRGGKDAPAYKQQKKDLKAEIEAFDRKSILPLAQAHKAWMKSERLANCFECNHDEADAHSGAGYSDTLVLCIQDTQDKRLCFDVYSEWLQAKQIDRNNLLLRALCFNQESVVQKLNKAVAGGVGPDMLKGLPWDQLIGAYDKATEALAKGSVDGAVRLMTSVGGPLMKLVNQAFDRGIGPALVSLGMVAKAPVIKVSWQGTKAEAIKELILRMQALNPEVGKDMKGLGRAIELEMRRAQTYGTPLGRGNFDYLLLADEQVVKDFPQNVAGSHNPAKKLAELAVITDAEHAEKTQLRWKRLAATNIRVGMLAGIFQAVALGKLADDVDKSMLHERPENRSRWYAGTSALIGTTSELLGNWMQNATAIGNRLAAPLERTLGGFLRGAGRFLGFLGGAIMAFWDAKRAWQEAGEGNYWVSALYGVSAIAGVMAMGVFAGWFGATILGLSATGVGIILVVVAILIAVLIEFFKDDKLQDWLERCYFGKFNDGDRYKSLSEEMKELDVALKG